MKILCVSVHAVLEFDEIRLLEDLGHQVFALGFYFKRTYKNGIRPPLTDTFWHAFCRERFYICGCRADVLGGIDIEVTKEFCGDFDVIIVHHNYRFIAHNWGALKGSRVIWRTIGQELHYAERAMRPFVEHGVRVARWSTKERLIQGYVGEHAIIRASKRPDEWCDWNPTISRVVTFNNNFRTRFAALSYEFHCDVVKGLPFDLYGVGNEGTAGWRGIAPYEEQREILRSYCATFVTGTWPAPYTLGFIEAWMTGIPVVHIGQDVFLSPEMLEVPDLIVSGVNGFMVNSKIEARRILCDLINDADLRRSISVNGRAAAIAAFGYDRGKKDWAAFLTATMDEPPCGPIASAIRSMPVTPEGASVEARCFSELVLTEGRYNKIGDGRQYISKEQSMDSWWSRFRRRTFAPSLNVFNDRISALSAQLETLAASVRDLAGQIQAGQAESRQAILEVRWRQDEIHAADNKIAAVRSALAELMGPPPTQQNIRDLLRLVSPQRVEGFSKIRTGSVHDGGYVMLDDFVNIDKAFSLGVSTNDEWDAQMADRGIEVNQYDHTIERAPTAHKRLHFFPLKVAATGESGSISLDDMVNGYDKTSRCILKTDIEGSEWDVLDRASRETIECFSQIVCEFHWLHRLTEPDFFATAMRVCEKLNRTHQSVHVHANNCGPVINLSNLVLPVVLEVTYARRATYELALTDEVFPTALDAPNDHTQPDIFLGSMKF